MLQITDMEFKLSLRISLYALVCYRHNVCVKQLTKTHILTSRLFIIYIIGKQILQTKVPKCETYSIV